MPKSPELSPVPRTVDLLPQYRQAAAVWHEAHGQLEPVTPQEAVSVVLLRDGPHGVQTFLCAHPKRSPFGPVAFPGGTVDMVDDESLPWLGPSARDWGQRWGDEVGVARRAVVAAARELFERTGVLVAGRDQYSMVETGHGRDWIRSRENILARTHTLRDVLESRHVKLRTDVLWPLGRWISPEFLHRRYDTRFFAVIAPERQKAFSLPGRPLSGAWVDVARIGTSRAWLRDVLGPKTDVDPNGGYVFSAATGQWLNELAGARSVIEIVAKPRDVSARMPVLTIGPHQQFQLEIPPQSSGSWHARHRASTGD